MQNVYQDASYAHSAKLKTVQRWELYKSWSARQCDYIGETGRALSARINYYLAGKRERNVTSPSENTK